MTKISKDSHEWQRLKAMLEDRIKIAQSSIEIIGLDDAQTNARRGEIAAYRGIIAEVEQNNTPPEIQPLDYAISQGRPKHT